MYAGQDWTSKIDKACEVPRSELNIGAIVIEQGQERLVKVFRDHVQV